MLTKIMQKYKTCNALISYSKNGIFEIDLLKERLKKHPSMNGLNLTSQVTTKNQYTFNETLHNFQFLYQEFEYP